MSKLARIAAVVAVVLLLLLGIGAIWFYQASQYVPEFYVEAVAMEPVVARHASDEMLQKATDLASNVQKKGRWQAVFSEAEINGWLAVDLVENHPGALPRAMSDPRVAIEADQITVACRYRGSRVTAVLSLVVEPYLVEPNVLAFRLRSARAGALPVPLGEVLDTIANTAASAGHPLQWEQADGNPVAVLPIHPKTEKGIDVCVDAIELRDGEVYLSGTTGE